MASGWCNKGYDVLLGVTLANDVAKTPPAAEWYFALSQDASEDNEDYADFNSTGLVPGTDYTAVMLNATTADVTVTFAGGSSDWGNAVLADIQFTASADLTNINYMVMCDRDPTSAPGSAISMAYFDLNGPLTVSNTQTLTIKNATLRLRKTSP
jgi:hypothetical protein